MKKLLAILVCICMALGGACLAEDAGEVLIKLGADAITVNGAPIGDDPAEKVYLDHRIETHEDVPEKLEGLSNRVVTIADGGTYRITGEASDLQLRVAAGEDDEVRIVLDGASIACRTAPAIAVVSAADPREPGKYGVTIELSGNSKSSIDGSHTEETKEEETKLSGAISSLVSLGFEGDGILNVNADNEGIEVKNGHLTFNGGNITVKSGDDALNASEDNVSVITINEGTLHLQVKPDKGGEGDGIDSNGSIVINGGHVASYAHPDSMDSGIDSDLGCTINGGVVIAGGNMYDEISADSGQLFMALQFAQKVDEQIVVTDMDGNVVAVSEVSEGYTSVVMSSPELEEGDYHLYLGGEIAQEDDQIAYTPGTQLQHGGMMGGRMGPGGIQRPEGMPEMPDDMQFPEGMFKPGDMPEMPEGMEIPEGMQPPEMDRFDPGDRGQGGGRMRGFGVGEPAEASPIFHLAPGSTMFSGIAVAE